MQKIALCLAFALTAAGCQQPTTYAPRVSQEELSQEKAAQRSMVAEAAEKGGMPRPWRNRPGMAKQFERVADRIDNTGAQLCQEMGLPKQDKRCYYYFELSRDRDLNAHADGKSVVLNSGMMRFLQNDDEVAIILAHELAHNLMGHIAAQRDNAMAGMLVGALLDGLSAAQGINSRNSGMNEGAEAGMLVYSVEFEQEADYVGLYIAARAGYDISQAQHLWRRLTLEDPDMLESRFGKTHPTNAARVAALQKAIAEIEYKQHQHLALVPELRSTIQEASPAAGK